MAKALDLDFIHGCPLILAAKAPDRTLLTSSTAAPRRPAPTSARGPAVEGGHVTAVVEQTRPRPWRRSVRCGPAPDRAICTGGRPHRIGVGPAEASERGDGLADLSVRSHVG